MRNLTIDLSSPKLVPAVLAAHGIAAAPKRLRDALDRKDSAAVGTLGGTAAPMLAGCSRAGPADKALAAMARLGLPGDAARGDRAPR